MMRRSVVPAVAALWLLTLSTPAPALQASRPPASAGHTLVYHETLQSVVLVNAGLGGMSDPHATTPMRLWRWDGKDWSLLDPKGPPIRNLAGVAYDADRDVLVLFGGSHSADVVYDETWEWSRPSGWTKRAVAGPGKRDHTALVYDKARKKSVLFGGQVTPTSFPTNTWTWDGNRWEEHTSVMPGSRIHHALVYDEAGARTLMFGGYSPMHQTDFGDLWAWTGSGWTKTPVTTTPRTHAALGVTAAGLILAGGVGSEPIVQLTNNAWVPATATGGPGPRHLTSMAYDGRRKVTVLYGGGDPATDRLLDDTWELDTTGWRKVR